MSNPKDDAVVEDTYFKEIVNDICGLSYEIKLCELCCRNGLPRLCIARLLLQVEENNPSAIEALEESVHLEALKGVPGE